MDTALERLPGFRTTRVGATVGTDESVSDLSLADSLRRISQSIDRELDFSQSLQAIVDAICDHTQWQLCWIYAMDVEAGFAEVVARRDRLEYTETSPRPRWYLAGSPSLVALNSNEVMAFEDVNEAADFPEYREDALRRRVACGAIVPLRVTDDEGRPTVLCVQSQHPLLSNPMQLPFLRGVAGLVALAAGNARRLSEARGDAARATERAKLISDVIDMVSSGTASRELLSMIERRTDRSLIIFDHQGTLTYLGECPLPTWSDTDSWQSTITHQRQSIYADALAALATGDRTAPLTLASVGVGVPRLHGLVARYDNAAEHAGLVVVLGSDDSPQCPLTEQHSSAATATGIVLLRDRMRYEVELEMQADVLAQLIEGSFHDEYQMLSRASFVGLKLNAPNVIAVLRDPGPTTPARAQQLKGVIRAHAASWPDATVWAIKGAHALFLPCVSTGTSAAEALLKKLASATEVAAPGQSALVAWSGPHSGLDAYPQAWRDCVQALDTAQKIGRTGLVEMSDFGVYRVLLPALAERDLSAFIDETLGPVIEHDRKHNGDLLSTVEAFAMSGGRFQETARRLNVHVSTLRYRLARAEQILGRELGDSEARFALALATRLERLRSGSGRDGRDDAASGDS